MKSPRIVLAALALSGFGAAALIGAEAAAPTPAPAPAGGKITAAAPTLSNVKTAETVSVMTPDAVKKLRDEDGTTQVLPVAPMRFAYEVLNEPKESAEQKAEVARLTKLEAAPFLLKDEPLASAIRTICQPAKMEYIAPRLKGVFANEKVTLKTTTNPYRLLQSLCETYGIGMEYKNGQWRFYEVNIGELIPKTYKIRYNDLAVAKLTPENINNSLAKGGSNPNAGTGQANIESNAGALISGITEILARPTTGLKIPDPNSAPTFASDIAGVKTQGTVKYSSDSNTLEVYATRQQHEYIKQWLASVDVPQKLVQIETQFVEVGDGDDSNLGLDTTGIASTKVSATGLQSGPINFDKGTKTPYPSNAVISVSDLSVILNALKTNSKASVLQNPIAVTTNNRKVYLSSTKQVPIQSANNSLTTGSANSNTASIDYLEIGTKVQVLPLIIEADASYGGKPAVRLDVTVTISSQQGTQQVNGQDYPVVSSRSYAYSVIVPDMHSLAIAGLRDTKVSESKSYTPIIGWIPGVREIPYIGCNMKTSNSDSNLVAFITPRVLGKTDFDPNSRSSKLTKKDDAIRAAGASDSFFGGMHEERNTLLLGTPERANASVSPQGDVHGVPDSGDVEWKTVKFKPAPVKVEGAVSTAPGTPTPLAKEAIDAQSRGDLPTAKAKLEEILRNDPDNASAKELLADVNASMAARR